MLVSVIRPNHFFRLTSLSKFASSDRLREELSFTAYVIVLVIRPRHPFENYALQ